MRPCIAMLKNALSANRRPNHLDGIFRRGLFNQILGCEMNNETSDYVGEVKPIKPKV
jgi:hypothetical protein